MEFNSSRSSSIVERTNIYVWCQGICKVFQTYYQGNSGLENLNKYVLGVFRTLGASGIHLLGS